MSRLSTYPIKGWNFKNVNSKFGMRLHPVHKVMRLHDGIDYKAPSGTPVLAVADGQVKVSKMQGNGKGYGNYIVIDHGSFDTISCHLLQRIVPAGAKVKAGQVIGTVGSTGDSTGPHLHFGMCNDFYKKDWYDPFSDLEQIEGDDELIDTFEVIKDGKPVKVTRIFKDGFNFIKMQEIDNVLGLCSVDYDSKKKMPVIKTNR